MDLADRINTQPLQACVVVAPLPPGRVVQTTSGDLADALIVEVLPLSTPGLSPQARHAVRLRDTVAGKSVTMEGVRDATGHLASIRVWVRRDDPESAQVAWAKTVEVPPGVASSARDWALQLVLWRPLQGVRLSGSMLDMAGGILADWQARTAS